MDVGNNSLRAKGSSPYGRREKYPPLWVRWYTLLGVRCTLRSECSVPSARGAVVHPARGAVVPSDRGDVYPPLGVWSTLRSECGVPSARSEMHTPNGGKLADRITWFYGYNQVYCPLQVLLAVKLGENHFVV